MKAPLGISQYTTWPLTFAQDLALYSEFGVGYIEVCESKLSATHPEKQLEKLLGSELEVSSVQPRIHSPLPNSLRMKPDSPIERMTRLRESIRLFGRFSPGSTLVVNTGLAPRGDYAAAHRIAVREFKKIASYAADKGVRIALEPLNPIYMNTDTFICSLAQGERMIDAVDHPSFGMFLDLWHFWDDPEANSRISGYGGRIFGVHVSDWRTPKAFGDRLLPGAGEIPVVPLLKTIRSAGYEGVYTLEIFSDLGLKDSLWANPRKTLAAGCRALTEMWDKVCA